jgi:hypothetical protein
MKFKLHFTVLHAQKDLHDIILFGNPLRADRASLAKNSIKNFGSMRFHSLTLLSARNVGQKTFSTRRCVSRRKKFLSSSYHRIIIFYCEVLCAFLLRHYNEIKIANEVNWAKVVITFGELCDEAFES